MNKINNYFYIVILISLYYLILPNGYIELYRSIPVYPDNYKEIEIVRNYVKNRTKEDVSFFRLTNLHIVNAYKMVVNENIDTLYKIAEELNPLCLFLKYFINRRRPKQLDNKLNVLQDYGTASTPSYPAGHAISAYFLSKKLIEKYPEKKSILQELAYKCDITRVKAGLHYPSDGMFSKYIVNTFF